MFRISPLLLLTLVSFTDHVGSVVLTRSPLTASDGELFTLICSSNTSSGRDRQWYRNDLFVFITTQGSSCPSISKDYVFQPYLAGRVNVSCDVLQHNVTLRIKSDRDNGTRWKCLDNTKSQTSHTVTIHVSKLQSRPATTSILSTPVITTTTEDKSLPKSTGQNYITAIAAGAAGGGVAVIALVIVVAACVLKRRRSVEEDGKDKTRRDRIPSKSAEMLIESGDTEDEERVMQDNVIYTSSSDVVPGDYKILDHNPAVTDVYTQVKKVKKHGVQHVVTDVYAKPNKGGQDSCNTDVYAEVNKVKKTASDQPKDTSENIEDMYAKPQKSKQNQQNNTPRLD
ncbi:uncharacterized protein LOC124121873 isoform X1 [Haliotis rufescens]|uniref:uncharacterized protein LOC124121873 isoform X1 n=1 Tax=Haliotis rufescens TaxID=6454 RepID=UPI00201FAE33|nr:uncharacterized protein LOC124121873 isoform X1 [Haliotis rufescens]XP_048254193.1 uncharacterized protein LOC124121873 isoform X1 [Haliotis rufescens]XP_048254194.1 uncharacterized protein LOC124121873 isoform X1 [Haliotis rufescens]